MMLLLPCRQSAAFQAPASATPCASPTCPRRRRLLPCCPASLNPDVAALLPRLASLRRLLLDGNQADDGTLLHVAALPQLRRVCGGERQGGLGVSLDKLRSG